MFFILSMFFIFGAFFFIVCFCGMNDMDAIGAAILSP